MEDSLESIYDRVKEQKDLPLSKSIHGKKRRYELVPDPPDGGFGWVVVFAAAVSSFMNMMCIANFGVLFVEFVEYFNVTRAYISWIGSIMVVVKIVISPMLPYLLKRFGCRKTAVVGSAVFSLSFILTSLAPSVPFLFFSMGLLPGVSSICVGIARQVAVQRYFQKKRALANSLSILGTAIGLFAWPPFTRFLIDEYTWRGACLILSAISLHGVVFLSLLRPPPMKMILKGDSKQKENGDHKEEFKLNKYFSTHFSSYLHKYLPYILMSLGWFGIIAGHTIMLVYTPIRASVNGLSKKEGAFLVSIFGILSGVVRVPAGWIGDRKGVSRNGLAGLMSVYCGIVSMASTSFSSFTTLSIYSALFGFGGAFYIGLNGTCIFDVVGLKHISLGYTLFHMSTGISGFIAMPLAGYLYDITGRPFETVITFGALQVLGGIFLISIPFAQAYLKKRESDDRNKELDNA